MYGARRHVPKRTQENSLPHSFSLSLSHCLTVSLSLSLVHSLSDSLLMTRRLSHQLSFLLVASKAQAARTANVATIVAIAATAMLLCWLHATLYEPTYITCRQPVTEARGITGVREFLPLDALHCSACVHSSSCVLWSHVQPIGWHLLSAKAASSIRPPTASSWMVAVW